MALSTPSEQIYFPDIGVLFPSLPPWSVGGEIVFPSGPSRSGMRTNHAGIVLGGSGVGCLVGPSRVSGFFFYRQPTHIVACIYIHITKPPVADDRGLMARPFVPRTTKDILYICLYIQCFPVTPYFGWVKTKGIYFPTPTTAKHHIIYSVVHDFLPSNNNSSTSSVSGYESSCFLYFSFFRAQIYIYIL